ncbi:MAG: ABC transporter substrate binding protein [Candidatus Krumholzibacteriia bacterium]
MHAAASHQRDRRQPRPRPKAALALALVLLPLVAEGLETRNVLVMHSYHQGFRWTDRITEGIESRFRPLSDQLEVHYEYLDTKRNPGESYFDLLVDFERAKTQLARIDFQVIIASDNNALRFLVEHGDELYPGIPVVFCGVNNYTPAMLQGQIRFTGVVEAIDFRQTIDIMRTLHPDRRRVLVILDRTTTGVAIKAQLDTIVAELQGDLAFEYYQDFILDEVPARVAELGDGDMIYLLAFNRDRHGCFISYLDGIRMVRGAASVPIYGSWDFYLGNGIVGGMIATGFAQGEAAADLALKILDGTPPQEIPVVAESPSQAMFDFRELVRFGVRIDQLPAGSIVINRPPGLFARYRAFLVGTLAAITLAALAVSLRLHLQRRRDLARVTVLSGLLPICANCKKIRDDQGYWNQLESYIDAHSDATFSHGICPDCAARLYPDLAPPE